MPSVLREKFERSFEFVQAARTEDLILSRAFVIPDSGLTERSHCVGTATKGAATSRRRVSPDRA